MLSIISINLNNASGLQKTIESVEQQFFMHTNISLLTEAPMMKVFKSFRTMQADHLIYLIGFLKRIKEYTML